MVKWEYCAVVGLVKRLSRQPGGNYPAIWYFTADGVRVVEIKGQFGTLREGEGQALGQAIAQLGQEGWELVSVNALPNSGENLYFKSATE